MAKPIDLNDWGQTYKLDKKGEILCPMCDRELAIVNQYGNIRCCDNCHSIGGDEPRRSFGVIEKQFFGGSAIRTSHVKDIHTRCIAEDGETVLKGKAGLDYMKSKADKNPTYAKRLSDYNKL